MSTAIAPRPPDEMYAPGLEIDCQCARCGGYMASDPCGNCEDGYESREDEDPLWYGDELYECRDCEGVGFFRFCGNSEEWCEANPMPGRESVKRGEVEWFTIEVKP